MSKPTLRNCAIEQIAADATDSASVLTTAMRDCRMSKDLRARLAVVLANCERTTRNVPALTEPAAAEALKPADTCCSVCGSLNVQFAAWVDPNTNEVHDVFGSGNQGDDTFCADCDQEGRNPNPSLLFYEARTAAEFNRLRAKRQRRDAKIAAEEAATGAPS